jgi:hypothetical protein
VAELRSELERRRGPQLVPVVPGFEGIDLTGFLQPEETTTFAEVGGLEDVKKAIEGCRTIG